MSRERRTLEGMVPRTDGVRLRDRVRRDGAVKAGQKGGSLSLRLIMRVVYDKA